jgi:hypothetical protein
MAEPRILFEPPRAPAGATPLRMDVALFAGFAATREGTPVGRPFPVESIPELHARLVPTRIDARAELVGRALPRDLALAPPDDRLTVSVDGAAHEVALAGAADPAAIVTALNEAADGGFEARLLDRHGRRFLALTRRDGTTPGTLAVLPNPTLGFPVASAAASRSVGTVLVRSIEAFFRAGGRRAWVLPMGAPLPWLAGREERLAALWRLLAGHGAAALPAPPDPDQAETPVLLPPLAGRREPEVWQGLSLLLGLEEPWALSIPDLAELLSPEPPAPLPPDPAQGPAEVFVRCVTPPLPGFDRSARALPPPALDARGVALWARIARHLATWLALEAPDRMLLLGLPPATAEAQSAFRGAVLDALLTDLAEADDTIPPPAALVQPVQPWVETAVAADLPGGLLPPEGPLAGLLGAHALTRGCFLSAGGTAPAGVVGLAPAVPDPECRASRFEATPGGIRLLADRTASPKAQHRHACVRRLTAMLLRAAQKLGEAAVFEPAGERLRRDLERGLEGLLERVRDAGGLRGRDARDAFFVRCDATTTTPADAAQGRVVAEIGFVPSVPVEALRVALVLGEGGAPLPSGAG